MKKAFALVLTLMLLTVPLTASLAAEIDLNNLTTEELTALKQQLDAEMLERGMVKTAELPMGTYIIGKDIPEGTYALTQNEGESNGEYFLFADEETFNNRVALCAKDKATVPWIGEGEICTNGHVKVALSEGQLLQITTESSIQISTYSVQWE